MVLTTQMQHGACHPKNADHLKEMAPKHQLKIITIYLPRNRKIVIPRKQKHVICLISYTDIPKLYWQQKIKLCTSQLITRAEKKLYFMFDCKSHNIINSFMFITY
jgi:hypothetical protein